jgi:hypothetical protein
LTIFELYPNHRKRYQNISILDHFGNIRGLVPILSYFSRFFGNLAVRLIPKNNNSLNNPNTGNFFISIIYSGQFLDFRTSPTLAKFNEWQGAQSQ